MEGLFNHGSKTGICFVGQFKVILVKSLMLQEKNMLFNRVNGKSQTKYILFGEILENCIKRSLEK